MKKKIIVTVLLFVSVIIVGIATGAISALIFNSAF